jgi:hypothetical protein
MATKKKREDNVEREDKYKGDESGGGEVDNVEEDD